VGFVLEYGLVYYSGMARTHMQRLERIQYRGIKTALGLMYLTPNNSLGVLSGRALLAERFVYLNFRYFVAFFSIDLDHSLKRRLETLKELNMGHCSVGYYWFHLSLLHGMRCQYSWLLILWMITWKRHFPGFRHLCI
jgi:hypothetical protein